jgi:hypothetical protein
MRHTNKQTCYATPSFINKNIPGSVLSDITFRWRTGSEERTPEITGLYDSPVLTETVDNVVYSIIR